MTILLTLLLALQPAVVNVTASVGNVPSTSMPVASIRGTATWYCGAGSPCTRGYGPSDLIAAIDPTTGIEKGERVTVWHGDRSVRVAIVDVCACPGARIVDLSRVAFSQLADPSLGVIPVVLVPERTSQDAVPKMTLPPTYSAR